MNDDLLLVATGDRSARELLDRSDNAAVASLLHGLLRLYGKVAREMHTDLGWLAIGVALDQLAEHDTDEYRRIAAELILSFDFVYGKADADPNFRAVGAEAFNEAVSGLDGEPYLSVILAVVGVWRHLVPSLTTTEGIELLRRAEW